MRLLESVAWRLIAGGGKMNVLNEKSLRERFVKLLSQINQSSVNGCDF